MTVFTCETLRDRLDDWVAGRCLPAEQALIGAHLAACSECRLDVEAATIVRTGLARLPASIPPTRELWHDIERRIVAPPGRVFRRVAVAALLILLSGVGLWAAWSRGGSDAAPATMVRVPTTPYEAAAAELAADLGRDPGLPPLVRAALDRDLRILDAALGDARNLLRSAPDDPVARDLMESVSRKKLGLLRRLHAYSTT